MMWAAGARGSVRRSGNGGGRGPSHQHDPMQTSTPTTSDPISTPPEVPTTGAAPDPTAPFDIDPDTGPGPDTDAGPDSRHRWWWAAITIGLVAVIGLTGWGLRARAEHATAARALAAERAEVRRTLVAISTTESHLATVSAQRARATATLDLETGLLGTAESDLARDASTLSSQGVDISELSACLNGVQQAMNAVSVGDDADAVTALEAAAPSCAAAGPVS